jgi:glycosyltransferase involved in cell wall biosynthesis
MIQQLIMQLGLHDFVRFEQASYCDMPRLYKTADIVVYPTVGDEPYGLVPVEAMSCSRPIVASDSGGIRETVINGVTGFIVPKRDAEALANRVAELIANPGLARRLGSAGRQRAQAIYNAERYVSDLMERFAVRA